MTEALRRVDDVAAEVLASVRRLREVEVALDEAAGRVAGADVAAPCDLPRFENSAMDGFACRAVDASEPRARLRLVGESTAGHPFDGVVGERDAVRIMTGAAMPVGADAVCIQELAALGSDVASVTFDVAVAAGAFVRHPGEDVRAGEVVVRAGTVLRPAHIGVLAGLGVETVRVVARPVVGVLSTGDELVDGGALGSGAILDANRPALLAAVAEAGCDAVDLGVVRDDAAALADALEAGAQRCDAVLSSGGVSVGKADWGPQAIGAVCGGVAHAVAMAVRPGKPFCFGIAVPSGSLVVGLPGNPVSALVSFEILVRPALLTMAGRRAVRRPRLRAVLDAPIERRPDGKVHLVRVAVRTGEDGVLHAAAHHGQASHMLRELAEADALAVVPDGHDVAAGEPVDVLLLVADALAGPYADRPLDPAESATLASRSTT